MPKKKEAPLTKLDVYEQIVTCTGCELHAVGIGPLPFAGNVNAKIAVLSETPGEEEATTGVSFSGEAAQKMRRLLSATGIDPDDVFWMNTACCWAPDGVSDRNIAACGFNRLIQLELVKPEWIILTGSIALGAFGSHYRLKSMRGRFMRPEVVSFATNIFVTYHPAAALRNGLYEQELIGDLRTFKQALEDGLDWDAYLQHQGCYVCGSDEVCWYGDGVPTCVKHSPVSYHNRIRLVEKERRLVEQGTS